MRQGPKGHRPAGARTLRGMKDEPLSGGSSQAIPEVQSSLYAGLQRHASSHLRPGIDLPGPKGTQVSAGPEWLVKAVAAGAQERRRYVMRSEIGRGGMGAVYEVIDTDLRRTLAMKVAHTTPSADPSVETSTDPSMLSRFLEEAQVTGQLDHPGIVPLHEVGMDDAGRIYFTMRLVKGLDLHQVFKQVRTGSKDWSQERAIVAIVRVCEAMAYAHSKGVVHRDLKPANIMTGRFGEVYVMDWGLAKVVGRPEKEQPSIEDSLRSAVFTERAAEGGDDDALTTQHGTVLGTPVYMAPEQARGEVEKIDARSDIYSLGAILYHLLAGQPPYLPPCTRLPPTQVLRFVIEGPPRPLREIVPGVAPELAAICAKAMAREQADRYQDMREFAEDLRMFLVGRPVSVLKLSGPQRALRWCRRYPMATVSMLALFLGALVVVWRLDSLAHTLVEQAAIDNAAMEADLLQEVNSFYVEAVAGRVDRSHVPVTAAWAATAGAIPLPATFLTELGERVSARAGDVRVRHYSDYPFKNRGDVPLDAFQKQALETLRAAPTQPLIEFDTVRDEPVLRYAVARRMEQGCVDCHNTHPDSTKKDWKLGEVRGVLEIVRPLATDEARIRAGMRGTLILVAAVVGGLVLAALVGVLAFTRRAAAKHERPAER